MHVSFLWKLLSYMNICMFMFDGCEKLCEKIFKNLKSELR